MERLGSGPHAQPRTRGGEDVSEQGMERSKFSQFSTPVAPGSNGMGPDLYRPNRGTRVSSQSGPTNYGNERYGRQGVRAAERNSCGPCDHGNFDSVERRLANTNCAR